MSESALTDERSRDGLNDADLSGGTAGGTITGWWRDAVDRLLGSDPGLARLRTALQAVAGMAVAVALAWWLATATRALQAPVGSLPPAALAAQHSSVLVVALLLAAMPAMMAGFAVTDTTARAQIATTIVIPIAMLIALGVGVLLDRWHDVSLAYLVVMLVLGVYVRRFGPRGFTVGLVAFNGAFLGYFLGAALQTRDIGWVSAFIGVGILASLVVRFAFFRPDNAGTLVRMRRSWGARGRRLTGLLVELVDSGPDRRTLDRIQRQQARLNESSLMIDAQLVVPGASAAPQLLHQRLFDLESALTDTARFTVALVRRLSDGPELRALRTTLVELDLQHDEAALTSLDRLAAMRPADDTVAVLLDRFGQSVGRYLAARRSWESAAGVLPRRRPLSPIAHNGDTQSWFDDANEFVPAVGLMAGWLPGSAPVSDRAGATRGRFGRLDAAVLPGYLRAAIQIGIAAIIAILAGGLLSQQRLYWALLATFLAFMATSNSGEQVRKALFRLGGTAIGIVIGALLVHLVGGNTVAALVIIAVSLFAGIYLIRINYTFMVIGITVTMAQLYVRLHEFSWSLLTLRLEETAIGVAAVAVTVLVVVPLRPQRVVTAGVLFFLDAFTALIDRALTTLAGSGSVTRADVRNLDAAHFALISTVRSLRGAVFGRANSQLTEVVSVTTALRGYARTLAGAARPWCDAASQATLGPAATQLRQSLAAITTRVETGEHGTYVRSAALFDIATRVLPDDRSDLAVRDLMLIDGALARLAAALGMEVTDHDTTRPLDASTAPSRELVDAPVALAGTDHGRPVLRDRGPRP